MSLRPLPDDQNIQRWLDQQTLEMEAQACVRYALAFNTLDATWLAGTLSPFVTYDSQTIGSDPQAMAPRGRRAVMDYWSRKIETLRRSPSRRPAFELAITATGRPCAAGCQPAGTHDQNWLVRPVVNLTVKTDALGMIVDVFLITVAPDPAHCLRSGIFPGLEKPAREAPRRFIRPDSHYQGLRFVFFLLNGEISLDKRMVETASETMSHFPGAASQSLISQELDDFQMEELDRVQFSGFPSVAVYFHGECILRHQGLISTESLVSQVQKATQLYVASGSSGP